MKPARRSRASRWAVAISAGLMLFLFAKVFHWASAVKRTFPAIMSLGWHLHHGFHADLNQVRFWVPLAYEANSDMTHGILFLRTIPPSFLHKFVPPGDLKFAFIHVVFWNPDAGQVPSRSLEEALRSVEVPLLRRGFQKTGERQAVLAGQEGRCLEYSGPPFVDAGVPFGDKNIQIFCYFGDWANANFSGTPKAVEDFYSLLRTAARAPEPHAH